MGDPATSLIDRRLGEFVLKEHLGEGGFGLVFRAEQPILERAAVVKVSTTAGTAGDAAVTRFLREARLASRLDHPFAAHVYAFGAEPDGLLWIAMELVRGTPLDVVLRDSGPLPIERAIPFLRRLCEVVHTAHEQGIVHRDLKPANVMVVARAGNVFPKLLDLGVARDLAAGDATGETTGTPHYMAPELWVKASTAGPPADVYALGALTFEVLTGAPPFTGKRVLEVAAQHARSAPPTLPAGFPAELSTAIARAMAKRAADRFPTALAFGEALRESSGISLESINLPQLDDLTRDEVLLGAPQPIAEAVAALDAARSPRDALDALWTVTQVVAQYVGTIALCCRTRVGPGRHGDSPAVLELLATLRQGGLDAAHWWRLARELCRPFGEVADVHPVPELVGLFFEGKAELKTALDAVLDSRVRAPAADADAEVARGFLVGAVPAVAAGLRALRFLHAYRLVAPAAGRAEVWMGVRRPVRATAAVAAPGDHVALIDAGGRVVVDLHPVVQVAPPAVAAPPELFWLAGPGRHGARLVAMPARFERSDDTVWPHLGLDRADDGAAAGGAGEEVAPYRGLSTFTEADTDLFFGREREVEGFVNRLRATPLIAVVGPSGAGKSSFVQAGVLPALGAGWRSLVVRPGPTPLANLCARLATIDVELDPAAITADPDLLGVRLRAHARATSTQLLVVVDQFEELFTLCLDATEQDTYADALVRIARAADEPVRVVLTLRDDFLVRAAQLAALRDRLAASLSILTTPVVDDLIRILVEPARRRGYELEDAELPREMVAEVAAQPAALALLSFTAFQLWQLRDRQFRILPRKAYRAIGGVGGALAQHAETTLDAMAAAERTVVREVFRHLVTADGTRAVLSRADLLQVAGGEAVAAPVLERLINARLLVAMESGEGRDESIEVVHEALLAAWPRLVRWRQEDAEGARLRDQLRVAARQWHDRGRARGLLWRGEALTEYRVWRARYPGAITAVEDAFGAASLADAARGRRLRATALGVVIAGLAIALVVFARLRGVAEDNRQRAVIGEGEAQRRLVASYEDQGRRALIEGDTAAALLFLHAAMARGADGPALRFMIARALEPLDAEVGTLRAHRGEVWEVAFAPDGRRLITAGGDGAVVVWDVGRRAAIATIAGHAPGVIAAAWSPDGAAVATADTAGAIRIWDAATGALRIELAAGGASGPVTSVGFDPAGARLLAATTDGAVRIWPVAGGAPIVLPGASATEDARARWSPDGRRVVVAGTGPGGGTGTVTVWTVADRTSIALIGHTAGVWYAVFDPAGGRIATASLDHTARIWDAATGRLRVTLRGHDNRVTDIAWSPDGKTVATASADDTIKLWDAETGETRLGLRGHTAQVNRLQFTHDGARLVSGAADGTARVWDAARGTLIATLSHEGFVYQLDVGPDDDLLATASWAGTIKLWRLHQPAQRSLVGGANDAPIPVAPLLTPDGARAIRFRADAAEVWNLAEGGVELVRAGPGVVGVDLDRAGATLAIGTATGTILLHDLGGARPDRTIAAPAGVTAIALSPSGDRVLAGGTAGPDQRDGWLAAWDASTGELRARRELPGQAVSPDGGPARGVRWAPDEAAVSAVVIAADGPHALLFDAALAPVAGFTVRTGDLVFSPDNRFVVTPTEAASPVVEVWRRDGTRVTSLGHAGAIDGLAFTPAGDRLLVPQSDGHVDVWSTAGWARVARVAAHDLWIPSLTVAADGALFVTAGGDGLVKVWDLAGARELFAVRVAPGTAWAAIDPGGRHLVTSDGVGLEVSAATRTTLDARALGEVLRCRLGYQLSGLAVVPVTEPPRCDPP